MLLFILAVLPANAQDDPLEADETRTIQLNGENPTVLTYDADADDVVTIIARTLEPETDNPAERDLILEVLTPDGRRLAYNDDHFTLRDDLLPTDAALHKLELPDAGMYQIRVDTYGGIFPGEVEVTLIADDLFAPTFTESDAGLIVEASLPYHRAYRYTFEVDAGEIITLTARDTSGTLDLLLGLADANDDVLAFNDDHASINATLNALDPRITDFAIPVSGRYTVIVRDFIGTAGTFSLHIQRSQAESSP